MAHDARSAQRAQCNTKATRQLGPYAAVAGSLVCEAGQRPKANVIPAPLPCLFS